MEDGWKVHFTNKDSTLLWCSGDHLFEVFNLFKEFANNMNTGRGKCSNQMRIT